MFAQYPPPFQTGLTRFKRASSLKFRYLRSPCCWMERTSSREPHPHDVERFGVIGVVQAETSNSWIRRDGGQAETAG